MKKKLAVFTITTLMAVAAAGCSKQETTTDQASGKVYRIATDTTFAPFEFENDKGWYLFFKVSNKQTGENFEQDTYSYFNCPGAYESEDGYEY